MIPKYKPIITDMFEYIRNKTTAEYSVESIVTDVIHKYRVKLAYYKCEDDMIKEFITQLCEFAKFMYTNKLN